MHLHRFHRIRMRFNQCFVAAFFKNSGVVDPFFSGGNDALEHVIRGWRSAAPKRDLHPAALIHVNLRTFIRKLPIGGDGIA